MQLCPSLLCAAVIITTFSAAANAMGCCISKCHSGPEATGPQPQKQELQLSPLPVLQSQLVDLPPSAPADHVQNNLPSLSTTSSTSSSSSSSRAASASNSSASSSSCCTSLSTDSPLLTVQLPTHGSPHRQCIVILNPRRQKQISPHPCPASSAGPQLRKRPRSGSPAIIRQKSLKTGPDPLPHRQTPLSISRALSSPVRRPASPIRRLPTQGSPDSLAARKEKLRRSAPPFPITRGWGGQWTRPNRREASSRRVHPQAMSTLDRDQRQLTMLEMDCDDDRPDPRRPPPPVLEDATISLDCFIFI